MRRSIRLTATACILAAFLVTAFAWAAEKSEPNKKPADAAKPQTDDNSSGSTADGKHLTGPVTDSNPYAPRKGLSPEELRKYIEQLQEAPASIHARPGFADGMLEAAEKILAAKPDAGLRRYALIVKLQALHEAAFNGDEKADKRLAELSKSLLSDSDKTGSDKAVAKEAKFYQLEQRVLDDEHIKSAEIPKLLDEAAAALDDQVLETRHLRIASALVKLINRIDSDDEAGKRYKQFGELYAKSDDPEVSAYGRRIAKGSSHESLVGKPLEISGKTLDGADFDISKYRGRVVLVDFWATWCPPCRAKLPGLMKLHEQFHARGFEVVGVSLDQDLDALGKFVEENKLPWLNLVGEKDGDEMKFPLAEKYEIDAIPAMFLVGTDGRVIARDLTDAELSAKLEELLKGK